MPSRQLTICQLNLDSMPVGITRQCQHVTLAEASPPTPGGPQHVAELYLAFGDPDPATDQLTQAVLVTAGA